ncbi:MAG: glycosyltransferase [Nitrospirae bacterium]|nr:MAG: glycosyltransferase [Nitrospirota bacterium]
MLPKISIVTPSYNQGRFLEECIDSILSQNYPNLEYIIMDGGSTDNSVEIIKKYEKHLAYWQSRPDGGQYAALNEGFKRTSGEIMGWLNSDDKLHISSLNIIAAIFDARNDVAWILGHPTQWDENGAMSHIEDGKYRWFAQRYLNGDYRFIQQESIFWRRSLWEKAGGFISTDYSLAGDMELWARFFRYEQLYSVDPFIGGFRFYGGSQKTYLALDKYCDEAESIVARERNFYRENSITPLDAPLPIKAGDILAYLKKSGFNRGWTVLLPESYRSVTRELFNGNANEDVTKFYLPATGILHPDKIQYREKTLFLGLSYLIELIALPKLDEVLSFIPSQKYFYPYSLGDIGAFKGKDFSEFWETIKEDVYVEDGANFHAVNLFEYLADKIEVDDHSDSNTILYYCNILIYIKKQFSAMKVLERYEYRIKNNAKARNSLESLRELLQRLEKLNAMGERLFSQGYSEGAEEVFIQVLELCDEYVKPLNNLGVIYWNRGDSDKATEYFLKALKVDPYDRDSVMNRAAVLSATGKREDARDLLGDYMRHCPEDNEVFGLLNQL